MDERNRRSIKKFLGSLTDDQLNALAMGTWLAVAGITGFKLGFLFGKKAKSKSIDQYLNWCLDICKRDHKAAFLTLSTDRHKDFHVSIWSDNYF